MVRTELNRVTAMLLSVLMILSSFSIVTTLQAEAETVKEKTTIYLIDTDIKWAKTVSFEEPYSTKTWTFYQGQERKNLRTAEGKVAYCVQPGTWMWDFVNNRAPELSTGNASVWNSIKKSDKIKAIKLALYFGYPNNNITAIYGNRFGTLKGTAAEREVATQLVLWEFILGYRDPYDFTLTDSRFIKGMFGDNYSTNPQNAGVFEAYKQIIQAINHWEFL